MSLGVVRLTRNRLVTFSECSSLAGVLALCFCLWASLPSSTQEKCILMILDIRTLRMQTFKLFGSCRVLGSAKVSKISILSHIWRSIWMRLVALSHQTRAWFLTGVLEASCLERRHLPCSKSYALTPISDSGISVLLLIVIVSSACGMWSWLISCKLLILGIWVLLLTITSSRKLFLHLTLILPSRLL